MGGVLRLAVLAALLVACGGVPDQADGQAVPDGPVGRVDGAAADAPSGDAAPAHVLVFSRTTGYRHESIPDAIVALAELGRERGFTTEATEDPEVFTAALAGYDVVVFLMTTGDVLDAAGEDALEAWVRGGGGWVGVHSAADTEYDWPFYGELVGAWFDSHPAIQTATILVDDGEYPATAGLPDPWVRTDEWYNFRTNPRGTVHVLLSLDEATYQGGTMGDHPHAWCHPVAAGRAFYVGGGHTAESYAEPAFRALLAGAVTWAGSSSGADCAP